MIELSPNWWHGDFNTFIYGNALQYKTLPDKLTVQPVLSFVDVLSTSLPVDTKQDNISDTLLLQTNIQFLDSCEVQLL